LAHVPAFVTNLSKAKFQEIIVSLQHVMLPQLVKKQLKRARRTWQVVKMAHAMKPVTHVSKLAKKQLKKVMLVLMLLVAAVQMVIAKLFAKIVLMRAVHVSKPAKIV
jgi:hypothetical protein